MRYPDLMRIRLFEPLGMSHTAIEVDDALVAGGESATGLPAQPWVMDAYAPGSAAVSTTGDLAKLATALLDGTAPGMARRQSEARQVAAAKLVAAGSLHLHRNSLP
jgi:CubicO group peptidase (beta-lactamase class C family)